MIAASPILRFANSTNENARKSCLAGSVGDEEPNKSTSLGQNVLSTNESNKLEDWEQVAERMLKTATSKLVSATARQTGSDDNDINWNRITPVIVIQNHEYARKEESGHECNMDSSHESEDSFINHNRNANWTDEVVASQDQDSLSSKEGLSDTQRVMTWL